MTMREAFARQNPSAARPAAAATGDALAILAFAAIGRASHGEQAGALLRTLGTALPFLIGWFAAALGTGAYTVLAFSSLRASLFHTARAWLLGGLIGLAIRSALEHRLVPASFAAIALSFNLVTLSLWRSILVSLWPPSEDR